MKKYLLFCVIPVLLSGCEPYLFAPKLYIPNPLNMPLARDKGELKANINYGSAGYNIQGSYATDSHLVILADLTFLNWTGTSGFGRPFLDINSFSGNIGAGYYKKFDKSSRFDALGGIGYGKIDFASISPGEFVVTDKDELNGHFYRLFAQTNIGTVKKNIEIGLGLRFNTLFTGGAYIVKARDSAGTIHYKQDIAGIAVFAEPCLNIGAGLKDVKLNLTVGLSDKIAGIDIDPNIVQYI
jgi:hypothetical protein